MALLACGFSPFFSGVGMIRLELASTPSVSVDISKSSRDRLEGVDVLLGTSLILPPDGTALGAPLDPPAPAEEGFLGLFFFLLASSTAALYFEEKLVEFPGSPQGA